MRSSVFSILIKLVLCFFFILNSWCIIEDNGKRIQDLTGKGSFSLPFAKHFTISPLTSVLADGLDFHAELNLHHTYKIWPINWDIPHMATYLDWQNPRGPITRHKQAALANHNPHLDSSISPTSCVPSTTSIPCHSFHLPYSKSPLLLPPTDQKSCRHSFVH